MSCVKVFVFFINLFLTFFRFIGRRWLFNKLFFFIYANHFVKRERERQLLKFCSAQLCWHLILSRHNVIQHLLVVKFRLVYATDSLSSKIVNAWIWYDAPGVKSFIWYWNVPSSIGIVLLAYWKSDKPKTFSLKAVKFPWNGGLHEIVATLPLFTETDKFDGGSGAICR